MSELKDQVISGAKWTLTARIVNVPIRIVTAIVLLRYLSRQDYGTYRILLDLSGVMIYLASLGFQNAISRFVPELVEKKHYRAISRLVTRLAIFRLAALLIVLSLLIYFWEEFSGFFNIPASLKPYLWIIAAYILLQRTVEVFGQHFHSALLDLRAVVIHDTLRDLIFVLGIITVSIADLQFLGVIISLLICEIFSSSYYGVSMFLHSLKFHKLSSACETIDAALEWKRISRYAFFNMFYTFSGLAVGVSLDSFVIARYRGMSELALYTFALAVMNMTHSFNPITVFKSIFYNVFFRKYSRSRSKDDLSFGLRFSSKLGLFIGLPSILGICLLAPPVITYIFKTEYMDSIPVIYIFAAMFLFRYLSFGLIAIINTLELVKYLLFLYILGLFNLLAAILLVQYFGIAGVAAATCSTEILWFCYLCFVVGQKTGIRLVFFQKSSLRLLLNTAVMLAFLHLVEGQICGITSLLLVMAGGALIYLLISYLNKPFSSAERNLVNSLLDRKLWVF